MHTIIVSGGFDPIHKGHIRYLQEARELGDRLFVILNGDSFLMRKKGYYCFDLDERTEILQAIKGVDSIYRYESEKDDVCEVIEFINKMKMDDETFTFAKGGDRRPDGDPIPEVEVCKQLGIDIVYGVGGTDKPNSSSWIIDNVVKQLKHKTTKQITKELHDERLQHKLELEEEK